MTTERKPLLFDMKSRDFDTTKDALTTNVFYDRNVSGTLYAVKRPGIISEITGSGLAQGTFYYNGVLYVWDESNDPLIPDQYDPTDSGDFGTFYALRDYEDPDDIEFRLVEFTPTPMNYQTGDYIKSESGSYPIPENSRVDATTVGLGPQVQRVNYNTIRYKGFEYISTAITGTAPVVSSLYTPPMVVISWSAGVDTSESRYSTNGGTSFTVGGNLPNNTTWTAGCVGDDKYLVIAGRSDFGAGTSSDKLATSTDGISWTGGLIPTSEGWLGCATNGTKYVIAGIAPVVYSTSDFSSFDTYTQTEGNFPASNVAHNGTVFCVYSGVDFNVEPYRNSALTSTDGVTWNKTTMNNSNLPYIPYGMCVNEGSFFVSAQGTNGDFLSATSTDGSTWTAGTPFDLTPYETAWDDNVFLVGKMVTNGNMFIALFTNTGGPTRTAWYYMYSNDGLNWSIGTLPTHNTSRAYRTIAFSKGKWFITGDEGKTLTSTDGLNWTVGTALNTSKTYTVAIN
jgi:hypothetical protein